jgi:hypothetical protein
MTFVVSNILGISYILPSNNVKAILVGITAVGAGITAVATLFRRYSQQPTGEYEPLRFQTGPPSLEQES